LVIREEAKFRKKKAINSAQAEIDTLREQIGNSFTMDSAGKLKLELKDLQRRNLKDTSLEERLNLVAK